MTDTARPSVDFRGPLTRLSVESPPDERPVPPWPPFGRSAATTPQDGPAQTQEEPAQPHDESGQPQEEPAQPQDESGQPQEEPAQREPVPEAPEPIVIYERKSRGLLIFTAIMVALTAGVILGQTSAYEQSSVYAAPRAEPVGAGYSTPPNQSGPVPGTRITAPLGTTRARSFEVGGGAAMITVRSADLGDKLYDITTLDGSAVPQMVGGSRLELVHTGTPGRIGADIQLNSRVSWKLRLDGGRLAGLELGGGAARVALRLPTPKGTIPIRIAGTATEFDLQAAVPVRVRLGKGADDTQIGGKSRHAVKAGTILTGTGWKTTTNRYDVTSVARLNLVRISAAPRALPSAPPSSPRSARPTPSASTASTAVHPGGVRG